jgi:hypothetical protein
MPRDINRGLRYIRNRNIHNPWLETVTRMIAHRIVEKLTMLYCLISQYYSGRRGFVKKNKYQSARQQRKQSKTGQFKNTGLFHLTPSFKVFNGLNRKLM